MSLRAGWIVAVTASAVVACGARTTNEAGPDGGGPDAAVTEAGAPSCGVSPHVDGFCKGWGQSCLACGLSLTACERDHFDVLCAADEGLRSAAYVAGITNCEDAAIYLTNRGICGGGTDRDGVESCFYRALEAGRTATVTDVATRYCAQCPFSATYGTECVQRLGDALTLNGWSDDVWASVIARCLPAADAGAACEVDFFSCAEKVFADAHPAAPCGSQRTLYF